MHDYSSNLEESIFISHIHGKASMWWDQLKNIKHIDEKRIPWKKFNKYL